MNQKLKLCVVLCLVISACSTAEHATKEPARVENTVSAPASGLNGETSLELTYILGQTIRRFVATHEDTGSTTAQGFLNHELVKRAIIDRARYCELLQKATVLVDELEPKPANPQRQPASSTSTLQAAQEPRCSAPFKITVRYGKSSRTAEGCRSTNEGAALSRLARDAEFLLHSKL